MNLRPLDAKAGQGRYWGDKPFTMSKAGRDRSLNRHTNLSYGSVTLVYISRNADVYMSRHADVYMSRHADVYMSRHADVYMSRHADVLLATVVSQFT